MSIQIHNLVDVEVLKMCNETVIAVTSCLADKYGFDVDEALESLDIKIIRKLGRPPLTSKLVDKSKPKHKRKLSGYNIFASYISNDVKECLRDDLMGNETLMPQAIIIEIARRWRALDEAERDRWNEQAKEKPTEEKVVSTKPCKGPFFIEHTDDPSFDRMRHDLDEYMDNYTEAKELSA